MRRTAHARTEFCHSAAAAQWQETHVTLLFRQASIISYADEAQCLIDTHCRACILSDYMKGENVSDLDVAYWFADVAASCCIFRVVSGVNS